MCCLPHTPTRRECSCHDLVDCVYHLAYFVGCHVRCAVGNGLQRARIDAHTVRYDAPLHVIWHRLPHSYDSVRAVPPSQGEQLIVSPRTVRPVCDVVAGHSSSGKQVSRTDLGTPLAYSFESSFGLSPHFRELLAALFAVHESRSVSKITKHPDQLQRIVELELI
ncbi:hypothetical protein I35_4818 [Burkholderia cenocepacia H111]|nr:hypothetical protein I35_4818 [Burkholderia cenocepacia H111]